MLIIGNYINNLECESFLDVETNKIKIRPLENQDIPTNLLIECLKEYRDTSKFPLGTKFIAEDVKVCQKTVGRIYLRAKGQLLFRI